MNSKDNNKKKESTNAAESKKQNEDFPNIPASSKRTSPPDIDKEDIEKASKNKTGKTDNTKK
jgi:hypothetical protein